MTNAKHNPAATGLRPLVALLLLLALSLWPASLVLAGSPQLTNLLPVVGQRGQSVEVQFYGARLSDATSVVFHTPGITAGPVSVEKERVKTTLTIAGDAPLGEHQVRLVTRSGVTEMLTFQVIDRPIVEEQRDERIKDSERYRQSTSYDHPQEIELGVTVVGRTEEEDADYYAVKLSKGQRLTVQVDGMSLGRGFTDSHLAVLNASRFEVAVSDDTALLRQDPYVSFLAPADGRYVIVIRDSGYGGGENNRYLMHVGSFPRPAVVFPLGAEPGQTLSLKFIGDAAGDFEQTITLPAQADNDFVVMPEREGLTSPTGHRMRVNTLPNVNEADSSTNNTMNDVKDAPAHAVPAAFNGIIESPGDLDYYKLRLTKGQAVTLTCYAGELGSALDAVLNVWRGDNKEHLVGNDDQIGSDSVVTFTAPEDGEYLFRVMGHRNTGGPEHVYRVEATVPAPSLTTYIHRYDQNRPQSRQAIAVPQGNRSASLVRVRREQVGGDLLPLIDGLPTGVTINGLGPAEQGDMMPVVFEAAADAPLDVRLLNITAQSALSGDSAQRVIGSFMQVTPIVIANPNQTEYRHSLLRTSPVAVAEPAPFRIDVAAPASPLVHDGRLRLKVNVSRNEGFNEQIRLYALYRPPGIGATGRVDANKDASEVYFDLDANTAVPQRTWPMVIIAEANVAGGPVWVSSQLFDLKVEKPFITGKIGKAKCVQGEAVDVVVDLEHLRPWTGEGELKLLGLPASCTTETLKIAPDQKQAVFRVSTLADAPAGQHTSLLAELTIQVNGEPVIHRLGRGGQLRIDKPRPEPRDADKVEKQGN